MQRLRSRAVAVLGALTLALAGTLATPGAQAQPSSGAPAAHSRSAAAQQRLTAQELKDRYGGKSVVGETSPIHDPALHIDSDGTWYVYSTGLVNRENGGTIQIWSSRDQGTTWRYRGTVWDKIPAWIDAHFADGALPDNLWAPEIHKHAGVYYLYYSASRFGTDNSLTALATNTTLDPSDPHYRWVDKGLVIASPVSGLAGDKKFNAIDPGIVESHGKPYLSIGSFWYGIFLVPLQWPSGKPAADWRARTVNLADRHVEFNPIEGAYITKHHGYFYLFTSWDFCCRGAQSKYRVAVGRSKVVTGPYRDKTGKDMLAGGGTVVLDRHGAIVGPGGQSVSRGYLAFHYYDATHNFTPTLGLQKIRWTGGWPSFDQRVQLPRVTRQPQATSVRSGHQARFRVRATGIPAPVAVWQISDDRGQSWQALNRQPATARVSYRTVRSTLVLAQVRRADSGLLLRAVLHNPHGTKNSKAVKLTVKR